MSELGEARRWAPLFFALSSLVEDDRRRRPRRPRSSRG